MGPASPLSRPPGFLKVRALRVSLRPVGLRKLMQGLVFLTKMFPWFLCLLSNSSDLPAKSMRELDSEPTVWWDPAGSARDVEGFRIYEGDILTFPGSPEHTKNAIKSREYLWEGGIIPYELGDDFASSEKNLILEAMATLEGKTCVKFVENDDNKLFIRFQKEQNGCYAPIGRLGAMEGSLPVNLQSPECFKERGIIEHELLHVVGLFHEQSRPDRDDYVTIHWCNILPNREVDFLRGTHDGMETFGLAYDFGSIMHYPRWAFSRNGKPTITAKANPNMTLGQRKGPSATDFEKVLKMYRCEG